jgi:two-component system, OmpR family, phosphate regulon response regulator OmpR
MTKTNHPALDRATLPHILVVDDDARLRDLLKRYLQDQDCVVVAAASAFEAREILGTLSFDVMILDVMMPQENGLEFAKALRALPSPLADLPILLLTAQAEGVDRIHGFEAGADDFLAKPFEPRELLLRLQAILRRARGTQKTAPPAAIEVRLGKWRFDASRNALLADDAHLALTEMEAGVLAALAAAPRTVISREQLAERSPVTVNDRTVDVQITRLRRKIEQDAKNPRYLITVRGEGYMLVPDGGTP